MAFGSLAWLRPLGSHRRAIVTSIAVIGVVGIVVLRQTILRDWLPVALIPMAYRQTGYFTRALSQSLQTRLESFDRKYLRLRPPRYAWVLELAYLFCYPLVPLGLVCLYLAGLSRFAGQFWTVVIPPAYACYATFPFVQTLPPRAIERDVIREPGPIRALNLFVLRHISIQANTFPSGHVAASIAASLALLRYAPFLGAAFLVVSFAVAAGAIWGRYHYAVDVILGALLAIASFLGVYSAP